MRYDKNTLTEFKIQVWKQAADWSEVCELFRLLGRRAPQFFLEHVAPVVDVMNYREVSHGVDSCVFLFPRAVPEERTELRRLFKKWLDHGEALLDRTQKAGTKRKGAVKK